MKRNSIALLRGFVVLSLSSGLFAQITHAADSVILPAATKDVAKGGASVVTTTSFLDKMTVSYLGILEGPAIDHWNGFQPDPNVGDGSQSSPADMVNLLSARYKMTPDVSVGGTTKVTFDNLFISNKTVTLRDFFVSVKDNKLITAGAFGLSGDLRMGFPVAATAQANTLQMYLSSKQKASYAIPDSRFTLGLLAYGQFNFYQDALGQSDVSMFALPMVDFQITPTLSWGVGYEMDAKHTSGDRFFSINNAGTGLSTGPSWDITPAINFNPFLTFYPGNKLATDTTTIGAYLSWTIL